MKKIMLLSAVLLPLTMQAMNPAGTDTLSVINNPKKVVVIEEPTGVRVQVLGSSDDPTALFEYSTETSTEGSTEGSTSEDEGGNKWKINNPFVEKEAAGWSCAFGGFYFGWGKPHLRGSNPGFEKAFSSSTEFGILNAIGAQYKWSTGQTISLAVGVESRNLKAESGINFYKGENDVIVAGTFPEGATKTKSNIHVTSLQFPLTFKQRIYKEIDFFASGIMNVNWAWANQDYRLNDIDHHLTTRKIHQRSVTFDIMGGFTFWGIGCYVRYRPQSVFKGGYGPKMSQVSAGVMLAF